MTLGQAQAETRCDGLTFFERIPWYGQFDSLL